MDYLQYTSLYLKDFTSKDVLNLIINGLPSILWYVIWIDWTK